MVPVTSEEVPVPLVQFPQPLDLAPDEMPRKFHDRDHGVPPWPLLVPEREKDTLHHAFPENGDGGDAGRGAPRAAFPRGIPPRAGTDFEE